MPAKRGVHDGVAAARARQRGRFDQRIDHRSARAGRGESGREQNALRFQLCVGGEPQHEAITARIELFDLVLMPEELALVDGPAERAPDVGGDRTLVARHSDQGPPTIEVPFAPEAHHELRTEPARFAVELVLTQGVALDEMNVMTFLQEPERHMARRDTAADDHDGLA